MAVREQGLTRGAALDVELAGLDALEMAAGERQGRLAALWAQTWPKLAAVAVLFGAWQALVWSGVKPEFVLPSPFTVIDALLERIGSGEVREAVATTLRRAAVGYSAAGVVGTLVGVAVSQSRILRAAVGSLITGLLTMPSIAWFPYAILLFKLSEGAMFFVVVMGAAPAVANGLIAGVDLTPPILLRAGRVLGATGFARLRHVVLPAALPGFVSGLKQGWAFSWRSLLAGELIVIIARQNSLGQQLQFDREFADSTSMLGTMLVILAIGILLDSQVFGRLDRAVQRRFGLGGA